MIARLWSYLTSYRVTWFPVYRIVGRSMYAETTYLTRFHLGPATPWGRCYLHRFHREDLDRDPHDHPFNFWTFPINQGYSEEVFEHAGDCINTLHVARWRWSHRPAEHRHRIVRTDRGTWPLWTLVWRSDNVRDWGFWVYPYPDAVPGVRRIIGRQWQSWRNYVETDRDTTADSLLDDICPGTMHADDARRKVPSVAAIGWREKQPFSVKADKSQM